MKDKPVHLAAALRYEEEKDDAPVVVASGKGEVARRIVEAAQKAGVPTYSDAALAAVLTSLDVGSEIPLELYEAVARVLVFVWQLDHKYGGERGERP